MKNLSGTTADTQKDLDAYQVVFLVEIAADQPGGTSTTLRYASRAYTLSGNSYADALAKEGISLDWTRLQAQAGLAQVSGIRLGFENREELSNLLSTHFLENDAVTIYAVFVSGSETSSDRVQIGQGVIEDLPYDLRTWTLDIIDGSDKDFREIPVQKINLINHPFAPFEDLGKPVPVAFGDWSTIPLNLEGQPVHLAPCRCVDLYGKVYTSGLYHYAPSAAIVNYGAPYQYYPEARQVAAVQNYAFQAQNFDSGPPYEYVQILSTGRNIYLWPRRATTANTQTDWEYIADNDESTSLTVPYADPTTDYLAVTFGGCPVLGEFSSGNIFVKAGDSKTWSYQIWFDGNLEVDWTADSGDAVISLSALYSNWATNWSFELLEIRIKSTESPGVNLTAIYLWIAFDDHESAGTAALPIFQNILGWTGDSSYNNGGYSIASGMIENPVHQLETILSAKDLYNLPSSRINGTAFDTAAAKRTSWKFAFILDQTITTEWLDRFGFEAGLHIYKNYQGKWTAIARDKTTAPVHFFGPHNIATKDARTLEPDVQIKQTPVRDVVNEVVLRYGFDPMSGEYRKSAIRTPRFRYTGDCTIDAATATLTDSSATFLTGKWPAAVGEKLYVYGDQEYTIATVASDTTLTLAPSAAYGACSEVTDSTEYWAGANVSGAMIRSWLRYKTINPLGGEYDPVKRTGGYPSELIYDDDTAELLLDFIEEWYTDRKFVVTLSTFLNAVDVELGDVCYLRFPWLPDSRDAVELGALDGAINDSTNTIYIDTTTYPAGNVPFRHNDYVSIDGEVLQVQTEPSATYNDIIFLSRGEINTTAAAHSDGAKIYLLYQKWEVVGLRPVVGKAQIQIELQEMPLDYYRSGIALPAAGTAFDSATFEERMAGSWVHRINGLMYDEDSQSTYTYSG